jgi:hypothetical protein
MSCILDSLLLLYLQSTHLFACFLDVGLLCNSLELSHTGVRITHEFQGQYRAITKHRICDWSIQQVEFHANKRTIIIGWSSQKKIYNLLMKQNE